MTPPGTLLTALQARGVTLAADGDMLRIRARIGAVTDVDRAALIEQKPMILELLRAEAEGPMPSGPCRLCSSPLMWVENWPSAGDARWLCPTCAAWPAPSLAEVFQNLTAAERWRLDVEAADGDELAQAVLSELRALARRGRVIHATAQDAPVRSVTTVSPPSAAPTRSCASCGRSLAARRASARWCSATCRHAAWRRRVGCERCRGRFVVDPAGLDTAALDDAVTLAAVAALDTLGAARIYAARRACSRLVRLLRSPA